MVRMRSRSLAAVLGGTLLLAAPAGGAGYEIGIGDVVHVIVLDQAALTGDFKVDPEGLIAYPFVGRMKVSGMTAPEVERKITTLLSEGYLRKPRVSVSVKEFGSQVVYVTGEFQRPGPYSLKSDRSLLALLTQVGDLTGDAGHEIVVVRPPVDAPVVDAPAGGDGDGVTPEPSPSPSPSRVPLLPGEVPGAQVFRVNLRELRAGFPDRNLELQARDTVYLPKAAQVYVLGHVARPGPYRFEEGLTVYKALLLAGGATDRGSAKGAKIVRLVEGRTKEHKPKMDEVLEPEDTLRVPERFF
jgi:polysaccharide export outer membrane protein